MTHQSKFSKRQTLNRFGKFAGTLIILNFYFFVHLIYSVIIKNTVMCVRLGYPKKDSTKDGHHFYYTKNDDRPKTLQYSMDYSSYLVIIVYCFSIQLFYI